MKRLFIFMVLAFGIIEAMEAQQKDEIKKLNPFTVAKLHTYTMDQLVSDQAARGEFTQFFEETVPGWKAVYNPQKKSMPRDFWPILFKAVSIDECAPLTKQILELGIDVNVRPFITAGTALDYACQAGSTKNVKLLLQKGAYAHGSEGAVSCLIRTLFRSKNDQFVLCPLSQTRYEIVTLLLEHWAQPSPTMSQGRLYFWQQDVLLSVLSGLKGGNNESDFTYPIIKLLWEYGPLVGHDACSRAQNAFALAHQKQDPYLMKFFQRACKRTPASMRDYQNINYLDPAFVTNWNRRINHDNK